MKNEFLKLVKKYGFNSIVVRNSINLFAVFAFIMVILVIVICNVELKNARLDSERTDEYYAQQISGTVETVYRDMEYLCAEMFLDKDIATFMSSYDSAYIEDFYEDAISKKLAISTAGRRNIDSIYIYSEDMDVICSKDGMVPRSRFADISWFNAYESGKIYDYRIVMRKLDDKYVFANTFIKKSANGRGAVIINIDLNRLKENSVDILNTSPEFYVVSDETVMYSNDLNEYGKKIAEIPNLTELLKNKRSSIRTDSGTLRSIVIQSEYYDLEYVYISSSSEYEKHLRSIYWQIILIIFAAIGISVIMSIVLSLRSSKDFLGLINLIEQRPERVTIKDNEITEIANHVIRVIDNNETLKKELQKRISDYESIKMKALQSQINSHFINNTLAAINGNAIIEEGYNSTTGKMIVKLSKVLKYSFIVDEIFVTLSEELEFIEKYIELIELRYGKIENPICIPDNLKDFKIPRMCLQVLVENAVFYSKKQGMCISVDCVDSERYVVISVTDNGFGMSEEIIEKCYKSFRSDEFNSRNIGLANVYRRLKLVYGDEADLQIESRKDEFTKVSVIIPKKQQ